MLTWHPETLDSTEEKSGIARRPSSSAHVSAEATYGIGGEPHDGLGTWTPTSR